MDEILRKVEDLYADTPEWVIWVSLAVGVLTVLGYVIASLCCGKKKLADGRTLLLLGSNNAGKTTLLYKICFGTNVPTHTSMKPLAVSTINVFDEDERISKKPVDVIDVPGHPRLRTQALKKYSSSVGGIVFVMDAVNPNIRDSAEFLYDVLTDPVIDERVPNILLFCNKSDCKNAKSHTTIRKQLEVELSKLKETRMSLNATSNSGGSDENDALMLGLQNVDFTFKDHSPCEVSFGVGSACKGNIDSIRAFVQDTII